MMKKMYVLLVIIIFLITGCTNSVIIPNQIDDKRTAQDVESTYEHLGLVPTTIDLDDTEHDSIMEEPLHSLPGEEYLYYQFFEDANVSKTMHELFTLAIRGDAVSQELLYEYTKQKIIDSNVRYTVFPFREGSKPYTEYECLLNIVISYLKGEPETGICVDVAKAYAWLELAVKKGSCLSADELMEYNDYSVTPFAYMVTRRINNYLPEFEFRVEGVLDKTGNSSYKTGTVRIHTLATSSEGGVYRQVFTNLATRLYEHEIESGRYGLSFDDWNFDGYQDVGLRIHYGGTGHNNPHYYWLWDNDTRQFVVNPELENISDDSDIQIDHDNKQLSCFTRNPPSGRCIQKYEYRNSEFVMVYREVTDLDWEQYKNGLFFMHIKIETLIDGNMVVIKDCYEELTDDYWKNEIEYPEIDYVPITD